MLTIDVGAQEFYIPESSEFVNTKPITVKMEHSLISISKWESIWEKPFLPTQGIVRGMEGPEEEISYIRCMIIGSVPDHIPATLLRLYSEEIKAYMRRPHSATTIHRYGPTKPNRSVITTELVYYWMAKFGLPFEECQKWHFNRLLMLIDVCNVKEQSETKGGKLTGKDAAAQMHKLNKERRGL
jgi:hypothetical protein